jgi:hypothetical protein
MFSITASSVWGGMYSTGSIRKNQSQSLDQWSVQWLCVAPSEGSAWWMSPTFLPEDGNRSSFQNVVLCSVLYARIMDMAQKPHNLKCNTPLSECFRIDINESNTSVSLLHGEEKLKNTILWYLVTKCGQ